MIMVYWLGEFCLKILSDKPIKKIVFILDSRTTDFKKSLSKFLEMLNK